MEFNMDNKNCCEVPLNSMPLVGEADYVMSMNPMVHCDRVADFNVLIYLIKGGMQIVEDGTAYELEPGTLFFLKNKVHHWGEKTFLKGSSWYYVHFYTKYPDREMSSFQPNTVASEMLRGRVCLSGNENYSYATIPKELHLPPTSQIPAKLEQLVKVHNEGQLIKSSILLWDILHESIQIAGERTSYQTDDRVKAVITYLKDNYQKNISSADLVHEIGFSYKYMGTLFKNSTGMTIKEYQLLLRLNRAENLLCSTRMSVSEIAAATGFYDGFHFSRVFKNHKGVSPLQYRKAYIPRI